MERVLIIDDSERDRRLARDALEHAGYSVSEAIDGAAGLRAILDDRPNIVVLDIVMPNMDGWTVCQRIRETSDVPVIMLTSLGEEDHVVRGLELGADDFVAKPISHRQLVARVGAVLRRTRPSGDEQDDFVYQDGGLQIDVAHHEVKLGGERLELSPIEFRLLVSLAESPGRVHAYSSLLARVWGQEYVDDIDFLRVYVWRLRRKIEADPEVPTRLLTERGFGYRFVRRE